MKKLLLLVICMLASVFVVAYSASRAVIAYYEETHSNQPPESLVPRPVTHRVLPGPGAFAVEAATNPFPTVEWVGKVAVGDDKDKWTPAGVGWLPQYELGLRSDGVVVWRKAEQ